MRIQTNANATKQFQYSIKHSTKNHPSESMSTIKTALKQTIPNNIFKQYSLFEKYYKKDRLPDAARYIKILFSLKPINSNYGTPTTKNAIAIQNCSNNTYLQ